MAKRGDISDIFRDSEMNDAVRDEVRKELDATRLISRLVSLRACAGLSQAQVAEKLNCSQGRISKFEHSRDDDVSLGELKRYAEAVNCNFHAGIAPKDLKPAAQVKCLAFAIHNRMKDMAKLAHVDEEIGKAVANFFGEVFYNMSRLIGDAAGGLPKNEDGNPLIEFSITSHVEDHHDELLDDDESLADKEQEHQSC